ncbi:uncharacterized protein LOC120679772 [Panicum virgatum]|uniref:uncharacterized protein LOC120679772 n=1 Tax=Panicum virgatum TaxID=38727 RepID=UPI0019D6725C|nr:uncharacterized protein LOC120679772 [Panicum virgatum]
MPPTRSRYAGDPASPRRPTMRKRPDPPAPQDSVGFRVSHAASPPIGMDDPASTSLLRLDFVAGEYLSAGPTPRRQGAIDSTARGPTATATSCRPIETYFISGLLPSVLGLMVGLALLMVEPEVMPMVQPFNLCLEASWH